MESSCDDSVFYFLKTKNNLEIAFSFLLFMPWLQLELVVHPLPSWLARLFL